MAVRTFYFAAAEHGGLLALSAGLGACLHGPLPVPEGPAGDRVQYRCDSGTVIEAVYLHEGGLVLHHAGRTHRLEDAPRASGARYTGEGLEWWIKGDEGRLSPLQADGWGGEPLERCTSGEALPTPTP